MEQIQEYLDQMCQTLQSLPREVFLKALAMARNVAHQEVTNTPAVLHFEHI